MTKYTPNYNLDLYEETDIPNLADQYNDAMGKIDTAVHDVHGEAVETANKLITINETIATLNTQITEVNAELAALGITDAEGAAELLGTINANAAGVAKIPGLETVQEQHTQEIGENMADISALEADAVSSKFTQIDFTLPTDAEGITVQGGVLMLVNANNSAMKFFGRVSFLNTATEQHIYPRVPVPGIAGRYGVKLTPKQPIPEMWRGRTYHYNGVGCMNHTNTAPESVYSMSDAGYTIGTDGSVYVLTGVNEGIPINAQTRYSLLYFQCLNLQAGVVEDISTDA